LAFLGRIGGFEKAKKVAGAEILAFNLTSIRNALRTDLIAVYAALDLE